ncbi:3081_t:CDS:2, partial [Ambispora leptoticha]
SGIVCSTYDASEAHKFCSEIDPTWQPILKNPNVLVDLSSNSDGIKNTIAIADNKHQIFCRKDLCEHIIQLIRVHFFVHPLIPTETRPKLYNLQEIWSDCNEWYRPERWRLWARSAMEHVNILRSSMAVESHWRAIKHNYLSEYNRARLDLLAYIIVTRVIPGQVDRLQQLRDGRIVTRWRSDLRKEWNELNKK